MGRAVDTFTRQLGERVPVLYPLEIAAADEEWLRVLEEARRELGAAPSPLLARVLIELSVNYRAVPDGQAATEQRQRFAREAVEVAVRCDDPHLIAEARVNEAMVTWDPDPRARPCASEEVMRRLEDDPDPWLRLRARMLRIATLFELGDRRVFREIEQFRSAAEGASLAPFRHLSLVWTAAVHLMRGQLQESQQVAASAYEFGLDHHRPAAPQVYSAQAQGPAWETGTLATFEAAARTLVDENMDDPVAAGFVSNFYAEIGRLDDALALYEPVVRSGFGTIPRDLRWLATMGLLARTCHLLHHTTSAPRLYEILSPYSHTFVTFPPGIFLMRPAHYYLGLLSTDLEEWDRAARHYEASAAMAAQLGARFALLHSHLEWGLMLPLSTRTDLRERARKLLEGARAEAERLALGHIVERAERGCALLDRSEHPVSPREKDVARLIAQGLSNKEIGRELGISPRTVDTHLENIRFKIGAGRRSEVAAWAVRFLNGK